MCLGFMRTAQINDAVVDEAVLPRMGLRLLTRQLTFLLTDPEGATLTYTISKGKPPFAVNASTMAR